MDGLTPTRTGTELGAAELAGGRARRGQRRARSDRSDDRASVEGGAVRPRPPPAPTPTRCAAPPTNSICAMMLIRTYRVRGHLAAKLDPLGLAHHEMPVELTPAYHGFDDTELDHPIWLGGAMGFEQASIRELDRGAPGQLLRADRLRIYAHQRPRGAPLHPGADRGPGRNRPVHARGQAGRSSPR